MIYKKVNTADRLPDEDGVYITDAGPLPFKNGQFLFGIHDDRYYDLMLIPPEYWMEPIDLPSEVDIENRAWFYDGNAGRQNRSSGFSFMQGGLWVLSEIKQ